MQRNQIIRIVTLAAYLNVLALTAFHVHHHDFQKHEVFAEKRTGKHHSDPFSNSDSICSVLIFSQTSYTINHSFSPSERLDDLQVQIIISNQKFVFSHLISAYNLRGPPAV
ncbi:MAG: hypothetical protein FD143_1392 [Ignavibacteria bacterium]|nr:MAG: hypothetical protein FD143_1392 [Ignavibacteria bacterium]KAF0161778.1 MAG: hypothetical protein FD188_583 [Ignavibacteria bacterium]